MSWFVPNPTLLQRLLIAAVLLFGGPTTYLYVWCRMTKPRWYDGSLQPRLGVLVNGAVADALEAGSWTP